MSERNVTMAEGSSKQVAEFYITCSKCSGVSIGKPDTVQQYKRMSEEQRANWQCLLTCYKKQDDDNVMNVYLSPNNESTNQHNEVEIPNDNFFNRLSRADSTDSSDDSTEDSTEEAFYDARDQDSGVPPMSAEFSDVASAYMDIDYLRKKLLAIGERYPAEPEIDLLLAENRLLTLKLHLHELQVKCIEKQCAARQAKRVRFADQ